MGSIQLFIVRQGSDEEDSRPLGEETVVYIVETNNNIPRVKARKHFTAASEIFFSFMNLSSDIFQEVL